MLSISPSGRIASPIGITCSVVRLAVLVVASIGSLVPHPASAQGSDWQQRVRYEMDVHLLADRHLMQGFQRLIYYNNSPDTLNRVYYHLYFNAFNPNSQMAERNRHLPDPDARIVPRIFNLGPDEVGYHRIESLTYDGRPVSFEIFDTVMKVELPEPILPHTQAVFEMRFASQVPLITRRGGRDNAEGIDYSMSQWYPKMAMYDERGWHADPYVGREFYAPFGTFDVRLTLPAEYVIGATGVLQNPEAVGHGYAGFGTPGPASPTTDSLTWHFTAENVHDFAWAADPDYLHDTFTDASGIRYHILYQPDRAQLWQSLREWAPALMHFYSEHYGRYPYPQFTVAQAGDYGMEYPMITFITGRRAPGSLLGTTAHELAHQWFYAMVASNESDHAWMDEGFVDYIATEAIAAVSGQQPANHTRFLLAQITAKHYGYFEPVSTPSDWFATNAAYGSAAYAGGEVLVDMLGYVISPPLRDAWLREYLERYSFRHPGPIDVEKVAEDVSGLRLDWYFEQLLNRTETLDYAVGELYTERTATGTWRSTIRLERNTDFAMPVDLVVRLDDGTYQWVNVPLSLMRGHKPVPRGWIVAEPWSWVAPEYALTLDFPSRPVEVIIDPLLQTPDANRLNNQARLPLDADFLRPPAPTWTSYGVGYRPLFQYASDFGLGAGVQTRGAYIFDQHEVKAMLKVWPQVIASGGESPSLGPIPRQPGTLLDGIDYEFRYSHPVPGMSPFVRGVVSLEKHLGILENSAYVQARLGRYPLLTPVERTLTAGLRHQYRPSDRAFHAYPMHYFSDHPVLSGFVALEVTDGPDRAGIELEVGSTLAMSTVFEYEVRPSAVRLNLNATKVTGVGPFEGRASMLLGLGAPQLATQKQFALGLASLEEAWRNDAFRTVSAALEGIGNRFRALAPAGPVSAALNNTPRGAHLLAGTLSLSTDPLFQEGPLSPLGVEVFSGAGLVWNGSVTSGVERLDQVLADAGVGFSYDVPLLESLSRWIAQSDVLSTLRLRAKFPLWAQGPDVADTFAFRWVLGVEVGP